VLQPVLQHDSPAVHAGPPAHVLAQTELTHAPPFWQALPQAPQFCGSLVVSRQPVVPQQVWPGPQLQSGAAHVSPFTVLAQHEP
jgi:hypothetical protein